MSQQVTLPNPFKLKHEQILEHEIESEEESIPNASAEKKGIKNNGFKLDTKLLQNYDDDDLLLLDGLESIDEENKSNSSSLVAA